MSSIPPVKDRDRIEEEVRQKIKEEIDYQKKLQLVSLNYYLEKKKEDDRELEQKMQQLAQKYSKEALQLQRNISEIVEGEAEIQKEEFQDIDRYLEEAEQVDKTKFSEFIENKEPIPLYWYKCLKNCPMIRNEIKEQDANVLNDLKKIEYIPNIDGEKLSFQLNFHFKHNDYFVQEVLSKSFTLEDQDQPIKAVGTHIDWNEGKDVTKKTVKKHQKNKKTGAKRQITKEVDDQSFFNFFKTVNLDEEGGFEKMPEEKRGQLEEKMNIDYDIARAIIDEVLPYSLEYYLNIRGAETGDFMAQNEEDEDEAILLKKKVKEEKKDDKIAEKPECQQQ